MEGTPPRDPLARERARRRRAEQVRRRRIVLGVCLVALVVLIVGLAVGLSRGGGGTPGSTSSTTSTEVSGSTESTQPGQSTETTEAGPGTQTFTADLTGAESVPAVKTEATGTLTLTYDPDAATMSFVLDIKGLTNPSVAAIYEGAAGDPGTTVLSLYDGPVEQGLFSGALAEGSVEESDLTGSLNGKTLADLVALIKAGNAYVSVGNTSHPIDAIRGQIK